MISSPDPGQDDSPATPPSTHHQLQVMNCDMPMYMDCALVLLAGIVMSVFLLILVFSVFVLAVTMVCEIVEIEC